MKATWIKLEDGTWGVRLQDSPYAAATSVGLPQTVKTRDGKKKTVVLGEHVKTFLVGRGSRVDLFKVKTDEQIAADRVEGRLQQIEAEAKELHGRALALAFRLGGDDKMRGIELMDLVAPTPTTP